MNSDVQPTDLRSLVAFNVELSGLIMIPPAQEVMRRWLSADINRALQENEVLTVGVVNADNDFERRCNGTVFAGCNTLFGVFPVSDFERGLSAVENELKRIGFLAHAEIGWYCPKELIWRRSFPRPARDTFTPKLLEWEKHTRNETLEATVRALLLRSLAFHNPAPVADVVSKENCGGGNT